MKWVARLLFLLALAYLLVMHFTPIGREIRLRMEGRREAERDIAAGRLKLRRYGNLASWTPSEVQMQRERLGVEYEYVGGCLVDQDVVERAHGYNERMHEEIDRRFGPGVLEGIRREAIERCPYR